MPWALDLTGSQVTLSCGSDRGSAVLWGQAREAPEVEIKGNSLEKEERRRVLSDIIY